MDLKRLSGSIGKTWETSIVDRLVAYVRIPNKSPDFDPQWERNGHMEAAVQLMAQWCRAQPLTGMRVEVRRLPGSTPLLLLDVPGELPGCVLLYGHLDKQPEFTGWLPGLGPWEPVIREGKLYGRGAADDGYAVFSSLTAIAALKEQQVRLPRCLVLIEACEESGSGDLPAHLESLGATLGEPSLVVCLDAECGNYDQVWCTTSLRGNLLGTLRVRVLTEGVHSGMATGIAPTPFRILEQLLARIENPITGNVLLPELAVKLSLRLPPTCDAARATAAVREALVREPPYGAQVSFDPVSATGGWNAPAFAPWLEGSISRASRAVYGRDAVHIGCGGTIPFMGMLGERFPRTQFFITGVLGPHANAHGPNEFLHIEYAKQLTAC